MLPAQKKGSLCHVIIKLSQISPGIVRQFKTLPVITLFLDFEDEGWYLLVMSSVDPGRTRIRIQACSLQEKNHVFCSFYPPKQQVNGTASEFSAGHFLRAMCSCSRLSNSYVQAKDQTTHEVKISTKIYLGVTLMFKSLPRCPLERTTYENSDLAQWADSVAVPRPECKHARQ